MNAKIQFKRFGNMSLSNTQYMNCVCAFEKFQTQTNAFRICFLIYGVFCFSFFSFALCSFECGSLVPCSFWLVACFVFCSPCFVVATSASLYGGAIPYTS